MFSEVIRPIAIAAAMLVTVGGMPAAATVITAMNYTSSASIPANFYAGPMPTFLEDFEDGSLDGGITASAGNVLTTGGLRDSVDGDDGVIDGSGSNGNSFFTGSGPTGITFTFSSLVTAAGVVWTDGAGTTTFSAFDGLGALISTLTVSIADNSFFGTTAEDTFFGVTSAGGIRSIFISNSFGGMEVDHVQYGDMFVVPPPSAVPLPAAGWLLLAGLGGLCALRRQQRIA